MFENVKGLLTIEKGKVWEKIILPRFESLGYHLKWQVMNAKDFGIPQHRERLFVVGCKSPKEFHFPKPVPLHLRVPDLLVDNADEKLYLTKKGVAFVTSEKQQKRSSTQVDGRIALCQRANQQFNGTGILYQKVLKLLRRNISYQKLLRLTSRAGTKGDSKPKTDLDVARPLLATMASMHRAGVDNYFTYGERIRKLSPRECLRLMGFSDSFVQVVSNTGCTNKVGIPW